MGGFVGWWVCGGLVSGGKLERLMKTALGLLMLSAGMAQAGFESVEALGKDLFFNKDHTNCRMCHMLKQFPTDGGKIAVFQMKVQACQQALVGSHFHPQWPVI